LEFGDINLDNSKSPSIDEISNQNLASLTAALGSGGRVGRSAVATWQFSWFSKEILPRKIGIQSTEMVV
jgi:uncharacterized protein